MTTWNRASVTSLMTDDRNWSIAKVVIGGQPRYELWRRNPARFVAAFTTADEAKTYHLEHCEAKP